MVAGSILPVSIYNNKLYFLFGKENPLEDSSKGWSDFGGGVEKGETPYSTAMREGGEELTGFLGDGKHIKKLIKKNGGVYKIQHNTYHAHLFFLEYDENLPKYYNQNHRFLWERMDKQMLSKTKLFEKIEIGWFSIEDMKKRRSEFRGFYQEIIDKFIEDKENILNFITQKNKKKNHTRKSKTHKENTRFIDDDII
jgi:8-oxo-dGTP pyrophosphatase MutT (NUDIX family)